MGITPEIPSITGELRTLANRVRTLELAGPNYYTYTTSNTIATGTNNFGVLLPFGNYGYASGGILVPRPGYYAVSIYVTLVSGSFAGRTLMWLQAPVGADFARIDVNTGETSFSLTGLTPLLAAGDRITPMRYYAGAVSLSATFTFRIVSL